MNYGFLQAVSQSEAAQLLPVPKLGRATRSPKHPFYLKTKPFVLQPMLLAPVLPGETMTNLLLQSRVVTDPIKNPLIGWWKEYYFFYVKLRDLTIRDTMTSMMMVPGFNVDSVKGGKSPLSPEYYGNHSDLGNGYRIEWAHYCMERIVAEYFRDEDVPLNDAQGKLADQFLARVMDVGVLDSLRSHASTTTEATEADQGLPPGWEQEIPENVPAVFAEAWKAWQAMRAQQITDATFEDYLKSFGVKVPKQDRVDLHIPELLRYVRTWSYPSNTVDPATGGVASAVSWTFQERADKDRFFSEPGFVFGLTVARPKVYLERMRQLATGYMTNAYTWLPALLHDDPMTSLLRFNDPDGSPVNLADDHWLDFRDLFLHGEQFLNCNPGQDQETNSVYLPNDSTNMRDFFPTESDINGLFKGVANFVREDGVVSLNIKTGLRETT